MQLSLTRGGDIPLYRQVCEQIRALIRAGALPPGARLPTIRELAREARLTRLTVQAAYGELQAQGLIESVVGRGTFVAAQPARPPAPGALSTDRDRPRPPAPWSARGVLAELASLGEHEGLISFAQAIPAPETYPLREFKRALAVVMEDPAAMSYGPMQGDPALREQFSRLLLDRGIAAPPEGVLITSGAQQAIAVVLQALAAPGEVVLVEEPCYPGMIELAAQRGQVLVGVRRDGEGPLPDALDAACERHHPKLLYTVPTYHNPTGTSTSETRRTDVLRIAAARDVLVIEDDIYGFLPVDEPAPLPLKSSDAGERVIYLTSVSKALMPGLRLGALVASPRLLPRLADAKHTIDLHSSPLLQRALAEYLRHGVYAAHVAGLRPRYRQRRDALLDALARHLPACTWTEPAGGLSLWLTLPPEVAERDLFAAAVEQGAGFARGEGFYPHPDTPHPTTGGHLRLSFGALSPAQIEEGVRRLAAAFHAVRYRREEVAARAGGEVTPFV